MANYITIAKTAANGADFSLAAGASTTLSLSAATALQPGCSAAIQIKAANGVYQTIGRLDSDTPIRVIQAIGTFRAVRASNADFAFGVERD